MTYHLLRLLLNAVGLLPLRVLYLLSGPVYLLVYHIAGYRKKVVRRNLSESFPEKSPAELRRIEKEFYHFFADMLLESCKMSSMSAEEMKSRMKFVNVEAVNEVLRSGKSVALFLGHYGNWEWISSMPLSLDRSAVAAQIYHKLRNEAMDRLMLEHRASHGAVNVDMYRTARYINELAQQGKVSIIGFIADQSPKKREVKHFLHFLNHDTPVLTGTEKIAKHYGFEPWFVSVRRVRRGCYEAEFVKMHDDARSLPDFELTAIYYRMLEEMIRRRPELYLWTHNRFKHARREGNAQN